MCVHLQDEEALYDAADRGDVSAVRLLISRHVNVNCKSHEVKEGLLRVNIHVHVYACTIM